MTMTTRHAACGGRCTALLGALLLSACASIPPDLGRDAVDSMVAARGQSIDAPESREAIRLWVESMIAQPLSAESAARVALVNNAYLQKQYARLGFGRADLYEAGRIRNPVVSASVLQSSVSGERDQLTFGLVTSFADLLTLSARKRLSNTAFMAMKQSIGAKVLSVAAETEEVYFHYAAAQQIAALKKQVAHAGALSAELATRFFDAGNINAGELAQHQAAASEAEIEAIEAAAEAVVARTQLAALLGLSSGEAWTVPAQLALPSQEDESLDSLLDMAKQSRLDLAAALSEVEMIADQLGVTNWARWVGELEVGIERERETDGARLTGPSVAWEVPIFNQHQDQLLRTNAQLQIALAEVREIQNTIDNGVRARLAEVEMARQRVAVFAERLIPQQIEVVARAQEEVNFMLIGVFELISLKQQQYNAYHGYLVAIRDYWVARARLGKAVGRSLPVVSSPDTGHIDVETLIKPADGGMDHSEHSMDGSSAGKSKQQPEKSKQRRKGHDHHTMDHNGAS